MYFIESTWIDKWALHLRVGAGQGGMQLRIVEHIRTRSQNSLVSLITTRVKNDDDDGNDSDNNHEDAEDQGADVQALGSGGVGLGSNHIAHHLPVPGLKEIR